MVHYKPGAPGLGDHISILQYCNATNKLNICASGDRQRCMILDIVSLFDNSLVVQDNCSSAISVSPHWRYLDRFSYIKAKDIGSYPKLDYIAVSLVSNSSDVPEIYGLNRQLKFDNIKRIIKKVSDCNVLNLSPYNIFNLRFVENHGSDSICDKFRILASAKLNICVDTGIAHLAAMTETPTVVIAPMQVFNRYKGQSNIHFVSKIEDLEMVYTDLVK